MTPRQLQQGRAWERRFLNDRKFREAVLRRGGRQIKFTFNRLFLESEGRAVPRPWHRQRRPFGTTGIEAAAIFQGVYQRLTRKG